MLLIVSGVTASTSRQETLFARQHMITVCKAHGLMAIDMVETNLQGAFHLLLLSSDKMSLVLLVQAKKLSKCILKKLPRLQ